LKWDFVYIIETSIHFWSSSVWILQPGRYVIVFSIFFVSVLIFLFVILDLQYWILQWFVFENIEYLEILVNRWLRIFLNYYSFLHCCSMSFQIDPFLESHELFVIIFLKKNCVCNLNFLDLFFCVLFLSSLYDFFQIFKIASSTKY